MIIVQDKKTSTLPHKHKQSGETINLLHGRLKVILYDKKFKIIKKYILNSKNQKYLDCQMILSIRTIF